MNEKTKKMKYVEVNVNNVNCTFLKPALNAKIERIVTQPYTGLSFQM